MGTVLAVCANWPQSDTESLGAAFSGYFSAKVFQASKDD